MGNRMAPSSRQPPLPDDSISDILLRLPPDDPAGLVRASAVCKAWRRIITACWVQRRAIDLKTLLPVGNLKRKPCFKGVEQDANVIFISTEDGVFSIDLGRSSMQARKVCEEGELNEWEWMYPFVSFYTESLLLKLASSKLPAPVRNQ